MNVRRILWAALLASTFVYLAVIRIAAHPAENPPPNLIPIVLAATSIAIVVASYLLPTVVLRRAIQALDLPIEEAKMFGDQPAGTRIFRDPAAARTKAQPALQSATILRLALREAIALYGVVLAFMGYDFRVYIGFFVIAWLLMLEAFPREAAEDAAIEAACGAKLG